MTPCLFPSMSRRKMPHISWHHCDIHTMTKHGCRVPVSCRSPSNQAFVIILKFIWLFYKVSFNPSCSCFGLGFLAELTPYGPESSWQKGIVQPMTGERASVLLDAGEVPCWMLMFAHGGAGGKGHGEALWKHSRLVSDT